MDEKYVVHTCSLLDGKGMEWQPVLDLGVEKGKEVWPIAVSAMDITCLVRNEGAEWPPEPIPRPLPVVISLSIPFIGLRGDSLMESYEQSYRIKTMGSTTEASASKEMKKIQIQADKRLLELMQLAIKSDRLSRVLDLCELLCLEKSWEMAVQLVRHHKHHLLADRIEQLHGAVNSGVASVKTNRADILQATSVEGEKKGALSVSSEVVRVKSNGIDALQIAKQVDSNMTKPSVAGAVQAKNLFADFNQLQVNEEHVYDCEERPIGGLASLFKDADEATCKDFGPIKLVDLFKSAKDSSGATRLR